MTSDDTKTGRDAPFRPVGVGMHSTFACASCTQHRRVVGRKLARVMGLRQWVCAGCAAVLLPKQKGGAA